MIYGVSLLVLGFLAIPSLVLAKVPAAKMVLQKWAHIQGWIGVIAFIEALCGAVICLLQFSCLPVAPIWWLSVMAGNLLQLALAFLLGYGLMNKYAFSKNEKMQQRSDRLLAGLAPMQGLLGLLGVTLGTWIMIYSLIQDMN